MANNDVFVVNHAQKGKWLAGIIVRKVSDRTYIVKIGKREVKRHVDDIITRSSRNNHESSSEDDWIYPEVRDDENRRPENRNPRRTYPRRIRRPVDRYGMTNRT